jgi:hypothetical protein
MFVTRGNWQEVTAYAVAGISLVGGTILASKFGADWLGRAGSLVIVCGILLASSRKFERLQIKVESFLGDAPAREHETVRAGMITGGIPAPTEEHVSSIAKAIIAEAKDELEKLMDQRKRAFKWHEVGLVTAGTVINGFGPWFLQCVFEIK